MGSQEDIYVLGNVTEGDIPQLFILWEAAFAKNRLHVLSFPPDKINKKALEKWYHARMLANLEKPDLRNYKITYQRTGQIVAAARWGFPHIKKEEKSDGKQDNAVENVPEEVVGAREPTSKDTQLEGLNEALWDEIGNALNEWREKFVKWEDTYGRYPFLPPLPFLGISATRRTSTHAQFS
jgi:hypothetical protein